MIRRIAAVVIALHGVAHTASPAAIVGVGVNVATLVGLVAHEVVPARATTSRSGSGTGPSIPIG